MPRTATYQTRVTWKGEHWGHIQMGNGPEMDFSAPPDVQGHAGVLTPEDAFVAAVNTCVTMMFLWAAERFKLDLVSYECEAQGTKLVELNRTEIFKTVKLRPRIVLRAPRESRPSVEKHVRRALESAQKYSLVANSIKSEVQIDPVIEFVS